MQFNNFGSQFIKYYEIFFKKQKEDLLISFILGRGGSDGCKIPMKIDALYGQGVSKVECGSQFSVALTRGGAVYTW